MVRDQIEARGVHNAAVLAVLKKTPRHLFVPAEFRSMAYDDRPLPIGNGQTISQPYIVGVMTELLEVRREHRVLEIGAGSGYQAAILAQLVQEVYSIEVVEGLAKTAASLLRQLGHNNVTVIHGDGYKGLPDKAPFDRVILTAAPPEIPKPLLDQLTPGGKLVAPVGAGLDQELVIVDKSLKGELSRRNVMAVRFVPMISK